MVFQKDVRSVTFFSCFCLSSEQVGDDGLVMDVVLSFYLKQSAVKLIMASKSEL